MTPSLGNSGFQKRQDFDRTGICYVACCMLSFLESLEPNDAFLNTLNTRNFLYILRTRLQLSNHCICNELNRKRCTRWRVVYAILFRELFSSCHKCIFCACLSSFSHDKLKLPPSSWDDFDSCGSLLQYRRSHLACSLLGRGYDVNGLSSSSFEPLFISDAIFFSKSVCEKTFW